MGLTTVRARRITRRSGQPAPPAMPDATDHLAPAITGATKKKSDDAQLWGSRRLSVITSSRCDRPLGGAGLSDQEHRRHGLAVPHRGGHRLGGAAGGRELLADLAQRLGVGAPECLLVAAGVVVACVRGHGEPSGAAAVICGCGRSRPHRRAATPRRQLGPTSRLTVCGVCFSRGTVAALRAAPA